MSSLKQRSRPTEELGREVNWSSPRMDLWFLLVNQGPLTKPEILERDTGYAARFKHRSNLSNYLHDLRETGYVDVEKREDNADLWYVTTEPDEQRRYTSVREALDSQFPLLAVCLGIFVAGGVIWIAPGYDNLAIALVVSPVVIVLTVVALAIQEVHG